MAAFSAEPVDVTWTDSKAGPLSAVLALADQKLALASRYDPLAEADKLIANVDHQKHGGIVLLGLGLYALGGWGFVVWGIFLRLVVVLNATWFVNSAAHTWGYRTYETPEGSRNLWWVGLVAFGEGWHNNHHAFQRSARHGLTAREVDMTWWVIRAMERLGLAWDVQPLPATADKFRIPEAEAA